MSMAPAIITVQKAHSSARLGSGELPEFVDQRHRSSRLRFPWCKLACARHQCRAVLEHGRVSSRGASHPRAHKQIRQSCCRCRQHQRIRRTFQLTLRLSAQPLRVARAPAPGSKGTIHSQNVHRIKEAEVGRQQAIGRILVNEPPPHCPDYVQSGIGCAGAARHGRPDCCKPRPGQIPVVRQQPDSRCDITRLRLNAGFQLRNLSGREQRLRGEPGDGLCLDGLYRCNQEDGAKK